jgi:prepilin-type N-terminal cleavage/methylation domain-containing protein
VASDVKTSGRRDRGLTLIELLIVVTIMGTLATATSAVIIAAIRTTPAAQTRVDDARGVQGLVTWLPQDVDAAAPDGFNRGPTDWPCAAPAPSNSYNVLSIRWTETAAGTTNYAASYRYEGSGTSWTIARYYCVAGGPAARNNLTSDLSSPWNPDPSTDPLLQPAYTTLCSVVVDSSYDGNCPAGKSHSFSLPAPSPVKSLKLLVDIDDGIGHELMIDAAPKNPDQSLAGDPDATANQPPTVSNAEIILSIEQNETKTFLLTDYFTADDPDGDSTAITVSVDPTEPTPENLVSVMPPAYQYELTLTAGPTAGESLNPLMLIVSDERGGWKVVQAKIIVTDPPNVAPTAPAGDHQTIGLPANPGTTTTLDIVSIFNVQDDAPLDQLRANITLAEPGTPPADAAEFTVVEVSGSSKVEVWFGPNIPLSVGGYIEVFLDVTDVDGASLPLQLTIEVLPSDTNDDPTVTTSLVPVTLEAGTSTTLDLATTHGVSDPNAGDLLTAAVQAAPDGVTVTISGLAVTITADASAAIGTLSPDLTIRVSDLHGAYVDAFIRVSVTAPPPPASNCVLGSLSATPNPVARQGGGSGAKKLTTDVTVTLTYDGTCDGLRLNYDSGDPSGLGTGIGRVFPPGSPSSIVIVGHFQGGTEQFTPGSHVLTASTSSAVSANTISTTLDVT